MRGISRKDFIRISSTVTAAGFLGVRTFNNGNVANTEKPDWLLELIRLNDLNFEGLPEYLETHRVTDESNPGFGGFIDGHGLHNVQSTQSFIRQALCSLLSPESTLYDSELLIHAVSDAADYLVRVQHDDGTIDLLSHNFYSPPDTAFIINRLVPLFQLLKARPVPLSENIQDSLQTFIQRASGALLDGGIHTPNHRWVFCAALGRLYELWPDERYRERAEAWLSEGIDLDEDGQYRERDTLVYSAVSNRSLTIAANAFDKPELLEYVRRNLEMLMYYLLPNGQAVEEVSERIEREGRRTDTIHAHYVPCRYLALRDNDGRFAALCRHIEDTAFRRLVPHLHYFLSDPSLWSELPASASLPSNYVKEFTHSGVVRIRRDDYDASIISRYTRQGIFFGFHKGNAILHGMRLGSSFSGMGQFESADIRKEDGVWLLSREVKGLYFQPLPKDKTPLGSNWHFDPEYYEEYGLMWHTEYRELDRVHLFRQYVGISEVDGGFELEIGVDGTDRVPTAVELIFRPGGRLTGVEKHDTLPDTFFLKNGYGQYHSDGDKITFGPGTFLHTNVALRGTLPKMDLPTVVLTGISPFYHTIRIT